MSFWNDVGLGLQETVFGKDRQPSEFSPQGYQYDPNAFGLGSEGDKFGQMLALQAQGKGPSIAENQLNMGLGRILASQASQAGSMSGVSPGMAARLSQQNAANLGSQANMQAAGLRAQEQMGAQSMWGEYLDRNRQAQMALEQGKAGQNTFVQQLLAQQAMQNAQNSGKSGILGTLTSAAAAYYGSGGGGGGGTPAPAGDGGGYYQANPAYQGNPWAAPYLNPYGGASYGGGY